MLLRIIRRACERCVFAKERGLVQKPALSLPPPPRIVHYAHEASACSIVVKVRGCDPAFCQRDHEIERPRRVAVAADGGRSHVVRIPALQSLRDWFAARYSGFVLLDAYSIRDRVPRQTFPFPLAPISSPSPPPPCAARSLPSEITAVALTAFSHVPVARVTLVVLSNERKIRKRERERERGEEKRVKGRKKDWKT